MIRYSTTLQRWSKLILDEVLPSFATLGERKVITPTSVGIEPATFG